jgi:riboflavin synthase alpha subunit
MFTGLVREIGVLRRRQGGARLTRLQIHAPQTAPQLASGDSLAVDGICLTVTRTRGSLVEVEAAVETLRTTTLAGWRAGRRLHLEPALRAGQALDGHLVLGHVDGTGRIAAVKQAGESLLLTIDCGADLARWLLPKGSVAVDGVSLTVDAGPHTDRFTVNLVPHTLRWTVFAQARSGRLVNLEMDVLVKAARTGDPGRALSAAAVERPAPRATVPSLNSILARGFGRRGTR